LSCGVNTSLSRAAGALFIANLENGVFIGAHAENGCHTVGSVGFQVLFDILGGEVFGALVEADGSAEVNMEVDDAGHDVLTLQVNYLGRGRSL
jgi:hypothetical protein